MPIKPPIIQRITDSIRNSDKMVNLRAPMAFLTPIKRVRSLTDTNIIFAMPKLPTISEKKPMIQPKILKLIKMALMLF